MNSASFRSLKEKLDQFKNFNGITPCSFISLQFQEVSNKKDLMQNLGSFDKNLYVHIDKMIKKVRKERKIEVYKMYLNAGFMIDSNNNIETFIKEIRRSRSHQ